MTEDRVPRTAAGRRLLPVIENMAAAAGPAWSPAEGSLRLSILAIEAEAEQPAPPLDEGPCGCGSGCAMPHLHRDSSWDDSPTDAAPPLDVERLRAQIMLLPTWDRRRVPGGLHVHRASVLALLEKGDD